MSGGDVSFDPAAMEDVSSDLGVIASSLDTAAGEVSDALARFSASSSEFVPALPAHDNAITTNATQAEELSTDVGALAEAARAADEDGIDLASMLRSGLGAAGAVSNVLGRSQAVLDLMRRGAHGARAGTAASRLWLMNRRWGSRAMPSMSAVRSSIPGGQGLPRRGPGGAREAQLRQYRENRNQRRQLTRQQRSGAAGMRNASPVTRAGERVAGFMNDTRTGQALQRGGRALGGLGLGLGAVNTVTSAIDGDVEGAIVNGVATAGGALMVFGGPVGIAAGAAITAGVLVYENWDSITDAASSAADWVGDKASSLADGARRVWDSIF